MSNLTISAPSTGPKVIQAQDFYQHAGILHPLIVGTIILAVVFVYLRLASNRSVAPMTLFDSLVSVAMGSTLAGVIVSYLETTCSHKTRIYKCPGGTVPKPTSLYSHTHQDANVPSPL